MLHAEAVFSRKKWWNKIENKRESVKKW